MPGRYTAYISIYLGVNLFLFLLGHSKTPWDMSYVRFVPNPLWNAFTFRINPAVTSDHECECMRVSTWIGPGLQVADEPESRGPLNQLMLEGGGDPNSNQLMVVEETEGLDALTVFTSQGDSTHHYIVYVQEQTVEID